MRPLTVEERALPMTAPRTPDQFGPTGLRLYHKYGITFVDLTDGPEDLELLRRWRNHPEIQRWMVFREEITPEMQAAWFAALDTTREVYSIVWNRTEQIGLTQLRNIDPIERSGEGGIILFKPEFQNGLYAHRAALAGMDWNFLHRGLETLHVTVRKINSRARRLVKSLGYVLHDPDPAGDVLRGTVTREQYFEAAAKWRPIVRAEAEAEVGGVSEW